ncbi:YybH family protein [Rhodococcoides corynebacterioides]|uniref:YybH family protein n=1 Tax=Rhodococcoides corynebacterioides TaxID=53972 RepID=UPI001C9B71CC|nr:nuclear transport factor 2 family protein [Rhodococcus corynebacterioides]MBY6364606.1 nuclear transport factor 2 family protein [Rhodococcus corynebacterioides]
MSAEPGLRSTDETTRNAVVDLIGEFADRIDHREGHGVEELFTEDGEYVLFGHPVAGRDAIRALYEHRRSRGPRTSRHLFGNIRLGPLDEDGTVRVTSVLTLYAADGLPPLPVPPTMIANYDDVLRSDEQGVLRFQRREMTVLFRDE